MAAYRLEVWFNYSNGGVDWGLAQANAGGNPPFSNGGTAIPKTGSVVRVSGAGINSSLDIYVFDTTGDGVSRDLQFIRVDYEKAAGNSSNQNPIPDASGLRDGLTGVAFCGTASGYTTGVGQEETVFSAPAGTVAQRRWSLAAGYEGLTPGHYTFTVQLVVTPTGGGQTFIIDPEMDIDI